MWELVRQRHLGKRHRESASLTGVTCDIDMTTVGAGNGSDQAEAKIGAMLLIKALCGQNRRKLFHILQKVFVSTFMNLLETILPALRIRTWLFENRVVISSRFMPFD